MKSYTLNEKSWHYWLVTNPGMMVIRSYQVVDGCAYIRHLVWGMIVISLLSLLAAWPVVSFGFGIRSLVHFLLTGQWYQLIQWQSAGMAIVCVVTALLALVYVVWHICDWSIDRKLMQENQPPREPGFIKVWYRSVRDKTCFILSFEDQTKD